MGGMQALEWAIRFPDRIKSSIVIASTHISVAQSIAFGAVGRNAIEADPKFNDGNYYDKDAPDTGLSIARMFGHITYMSDASMRKKFGRALRDGTELKYEFGSEFSVETYLDYQGEQFVGRFDANSYLYITKAIDYFDISLGFDSLDKAIEKIQSKMLVLAYSSDWLYPPRQSEEIVYSMARYNKDVSYCSIKSDYGHDAFLLEFDIMLNIITGYLEYATHDHSCSIEVCSNECNLYRDEKHGSVDKPEIYRSKRTDYSLIVDLIKAGSRVLDIGCGDGELLCHLINLKHVSAMGMELNQELFIRSIQRGISVVQADIDKGLGALSDQSFDYVILSMTLQVIQKADLVIREMLRVGKKCIVSFPNFGHWNVRLKTLQGNAPVTRNLPYSWYDTPNYHVLTIKDFRKFCAEQGAKIEQEIPLTKNGIRRILPNLLAEEAVYIISAEKS